MGHFVEGSKNLLRVNHKKQAEARVVNNDVRDFRHLPCTTTEVPTGFSGTAPWLDSSFFFASENQKWHCCSKDARVDDVAEVRSSGTSSEDFVLSRGNRRVLHRVLNTTQILDHCHDLKHFVLTVSHSLTKYHSVRTV